MVYGVFLCNENVNLKKKKGGYKTRGLKERERDYFVLFCSFYLKKKKKKETALSFSLSLNFLFFLSAIFF